MTKDCPSCRAHEQTPWKRKKLRNRTGTKRSPCSELQRKSRRPMREKEVCQGGRSSARLATCFWPTFPAGDKNLSSLVVIWLLFILVGTLIQNSSGPIPKNQIR